MTQLPQRTLSTRLPAPAYIAIAVLALVLMFVLPRGVAFVVLIAPFVVGMTIGAVYSFRNAYRVPLYLREHVGARWLNAKTALVIAVLATLTFHPSTGGRYWFLGILITLVGGVVLAATPTPHPFTTTYRVAPLSKLLRWHWVSAAAGVAFLVVTMIRSLPAFWGDPPALLNVHVQHALLIGGLALILAGLGGWRLSQPRLNRTMLVIGAIGLGALVLRVLQLETHIPFMIEEWLFVQPAGHMNKNLDVPLFYQISFYATSPRLYVYWQAFGGGLLGGGTFGLRVVSAVTGAVAVVAAGFLAHELFDTKTDKNQHGLTIPVSVLAALVLALYPVHLHYSRLALFNVMDTVTTVLAAAFLLRALRLNERMSYAAAGVALSMTHYFYEVAKVMSLPLLVLWLIGAVVLYGERALLRRWRGLALTGVIAGFIMVLPWIVDRASSANSLARLLVSSVVLDSNTSFRDKAEHTIFMLPNSITTLTSHSDLRLDYFISGQGLVPTWMLPFFLFGLMVMIARPGRPAHLLMLLWVLATIGGNALVLAIITPRYLIVFPAVAVITAYGVASATRGWFQARWHRPAALVVVIALGVINGVWYWYTVVPAHVEKHFNIVQQIGAYSMEDLIARMDAYPDGTMVHVFAPRHNEVLYGVSNYHHPQIALNLIETEDDDELTDYIRNLPGFVPNVVFVQPGDEATVAQLERYYTLSAPMTSDADIPDSTKLVGYSVLERKPQSVLDE